MSDEDVIGILLLAPAVLVGLILLFYMAYKQWRER